MLPGGGVDPANDRSSSCARVARGDGARRNPHPYLYTFDTASNRHHTFAVEADGALDEDGVKSSGEIHGFLWWDMQSDVPVYPHVTAVRDWLRISGSGSFQPES